MNTRIFMVRHAEAEGNAKRIFHGWTDSEITERGRKQAELVAERFKDENIDVLYSSSLKRTVQTAEYIAKKKCLDIIKTDLLKEINGGEWEGMPWSELIEKYPREHYTWENNMIDHAMPGGESIKDFEKRLYDIFQKIIKKNEGKNICIVTHGTAIRTLMCHFYGCGLEGILDIPWVDNTAVTILDYESGRYKVITDGDVSHLPKELCTIRNQEWYDEHIKN